MSDRKTFWVLIHMVLFVPATVLRRGYLSSVQSRVALDAYFDAQLDALAVVQITMLSSHWWFFFRRTISKPQPRQVRLPLEQANYFSRPRCSQPSTQYRSRTYKLQKPSQGLGKPPMSDIEPELGPQIRIPDRTCPLVSLSGASDPKLALATLFNMFFCSLDKTSAGGMGLRETRCTQRRRKRVSTCVQFFGCDPA